MFAGLPSLYLATPAQAHSVPIAGITEREKYSRASPGNVLGVCGSEPAALQLSGCFHRKAGSCPVAAGSVCKTLKTKVARGKFKRTAMQQVVRTGARAADR